MGSRLVCEGAVHCVSEFCALTSSAKFLQITGRGEVKYPMVLLEMPLLLSLFPVVMHRISSWLVTAGCDLQIHRNLLGCNLFLNLQNNFYNLPETHMQVLEKLSIDCQGIRISLVRMESHHYFVRLFQVSYLFRSPIFPVSYFLISLLCVTMCLFYRT